MYSALIETLHAGGPNIGGLSTKDILLGAIMHTKETSMANFIAMFTKYYIQRQKLFHEGNLSLIGWLAEFRKRLLSERYICALEGKASRFAKWNRVLQALG